MNKRDRRAVEKKRRSKPVSPITRRQQVAAIKEIKGQEIATAVSNNIRGAVSQELEEKLGTLKDTMLNLIDRVVDLEQREILRDCNGTDRPERTEGSEV